MVDDTNNSRITNCIKAAFIFAVFASFVSKYFNHPWVIFIVPSTALATLAIVLTYCVED